MDIIFRFKPVYGIQFEFDYFSSAEIGQVRFLLFGLFVGSLSSLSLICLTLNFIVMPSKAKKNELPKPKSGDVLEALLKWFVPL